MKIILMSQTNVLQHYLGITIGTLGLAYVVRNQIWKYFQKESDGKVSVGQLLTQPEEETRQNLENDTWIIYSGPQTLNWLENNLLASINLDKVAVLEYRETIGAYKTDTIVDLAETSRKVLIVLGPESHQDELLQYQVHAALKSRDPDDILVCHLWGYSSTLKCLKYLERIRKDETPTDDFIRKMNSFINCL